MVDIKEEAFEIVDGKSLDNAISDICIGLLRVGSNLAELAKVEAKKAFEEFSDRYRKEIPNAGVVGAVLSSKDVICIEEVLDYFDGSWKIQTDLVWPPPKPITI